MQVILTSRPVGKNPISWVNAITRIKTRSPFDHVAIVDNEGTVYESVAGEGVRDIFYKDWRKGRKGTYAFCYNVPEEVEVNLGKYFELKGRGYDYKANLLFLFGLDRYLKKHSTKHLFCSELVATMLNLENPWGYTPDDIERFARAEGWDVRIYTI